MNRICRLTSPDVFSSSQSPLDPTVLRLARDIHDPSNLSEDYVRAIRALEATHHEHAALVIGDFLDMAGPVGDEAVRALVFLARSAGRRCRYSVCEDCGIRIWVSVDEDEIRNAHRVLAALGNEASQRALAEPPRRDPRRMTMSSRDLAYAFIAKHYRDPGGTDPVRRFLPHPDVARAICGALLANGVARRDLEDRLQDVYVRVLTAIREGTTVPPADLRAMKAYCATAAVNVAMDVFREIAKQKRDLAATCECKEENDEKKGKESRKRKLALPEPDRREAHERADVSKQVEVLAKLFREGCMPADGEAILEGAAAGFSHGEIGKKLGITKELVRWRMREIRRIYRERLVELGFMAPPPPLRLVVDNPSAVSSLRVAV